VWFERVDMEMRSVVHVNDTERGIWRTVGEDWLLHRRLAVLDTPFDGMYRIM